MGYKSILSVAIATCFLIGVNGQWDPNFVPGRHSMVHLFEWRWDDIAQECERFLGPNGYGGVQVSPPTENAVIGDRPWWERYQPVSYHLNTRSGTEQEFQSMVQRCNAVGVRIYADVVINHMTGGIGAGYGTGGSYFDSNEKSYPGVPYSVFDFNGRDQCPTASGEIEDYNDPIQVRNCKLVGLKDLNQGTEYVRARITDYLNKLIGYGVAGFRVDASKHMWPADMEVIFNRLNNLPTEHGFPSGARPFIATEVIDLGNEPIKGSDYYHLGRVTEFKYGAALGRVFRRYDLLKYLVNFGEGWGMYPDGNAFVFIDNHDNQRGHGAGGADILTFRVSRMYKMATAFMMAWPYGIVRVMSSYDFPVGANDQGPPNTNGNINPVPINPDGTCGGGWICEHRWRQIFNMNKFRNVVAGTGVNDWWDNDQNQIAFCRGDKGFIAINNDDFALRGTFQTCLPAGSYCDVISGSLEDGQCTGKVIDVAGDGTAYIDISNTDYDPVIAIHAESRV